MSLHAGSNEARRTHRATPIAVGMITVESKPTESPSTPSPMHTGRTCSEDVIDCASGKALATRVEVKTVWLRDVNVVDGSVTVIVTEEVTRNVVSRLEKLEPSVELCVGIGSEFDMVG